MAKSLLLESIIEATRNALNAVSDRILRLDLSRDWPIGEALVKLNKSEPVRALIQRPFDADAFSDIESTTSVGVAINWRNARRRAYAVAIVGQYSGRLDAGLKDVKKVTRRDVARIWHRKAAEEFRGHADLAKKDVLRLLEKIFEDLTDGVVSASRLETYIDLALKAKSVDAVRDGLWVIGLMKDSHAVDMGVSSVRLQRNREVVEQLRASDDLRIDARLTAAAQEGGVRAKVARAALSFRTEGKEERLKDIDLAVIDEILKSVPEARAKPLDVVDVLNLHRGHAKEVRACLERAAEEWDLEECADEIGSQLTINGEAKAVQIPLLPSVQQDDGTSEEKLESRWTGSSDVEAVFASQSNSSEPEVLGASEQKHLQLAVLCESLGKLKTLPGYLEARAGMRRYEPWLGSDRHAFTLLLLKPEARDAARRFVEGWVELVFEAAVLDEGKSEIETVQVLETVQASGDEPEWVALGPLHPYRLDPVLRVAEQTARRLGIEGDVELLGDAAMWALDRCYPAYPDLYRGDKTLHRAMSRGIVVYQSHGGKHLPGARDSGGLDRVLRAIEKYCPWLQDGATVLAIDPPSGGGVVRALDNASKRDARRELRVFHLATNKESDALSGFEGDVQFLPPVSSLSEAKGLPDSNVVLRFVGESAGGSEAATSDWAATRGTHLALRLQDESQGGPFDGKKTPIIRIDPRIGNRVVIGLQKLFAKRKGGGVPVVASIKPLLQTDDAVNLSKMAGSTDWLVFAAPGPLGLVSPRTINTSLRFVGRSAMGGYGLYVYAADELFAVRRYFEQYFRNTPVASVPAPVMVQQLVDKAQDSAGAVLFAALGGVQTQVAAVVALAVAREGLKAEETFVLSLDEMGWTHAWLGPGVRADYLVVGINGDGGIVFRVVESKSVEKGTAIAFSESTPQFEEAISQVTKTLSVLREITESEEPSLDEDLRYASLIEHLMAALLSKAGDFSEQRRKVVFEAVNALSQRRVRPDFQGYAVVTQSGVTSERLSKKTSEGIRLVWAGAKDVSEVFGLEEAAVGATSDEPIAELGEREMEEKAQPATEATMGQEKNAQTEGDNATASDADAFIMAARLHGVPLEGEKPTYVLYGPSLVTFGVKVREGATIQPLRARLSDIARDIGLGDRSQLIEVENDSEPRTIRVLLPREQRVFPALPETQVQAIIDDGYLPVFLGQTVSGEDFRTTVESWPHMLVAGTTGSGKTTFIRTLLRQFSVFGASLLTVVIVDGKGDTDYLGVVPSDMFPEEFPDVQLGHQTATPVLRWVADQMELRQKALLDIAKKSPSPHGVKAASIFKDQVNQGRSPQIRPLLVVIDEFADIMLAGRRSSDEFESLVQRISQVGRSRLIHLILATQRPDKETIRGAIKANLNARVVLRLPTVADSMTVLGKSGAEKLMLLGDMLFQYGSGAPTRLQGYRG